MAMRSGSIWLLTRSSCFLKVVSLAEFPVGLLIDPARVCLHTLHRFCFVYSYTTYHSCAKVKKMECFIVWRHQLTLIAAADMPTKAKASARKRKQVLMSESDESGEEESAPDSGSDWSEAGKEAAADPDEAADDDDVSMAGDSDNSPEGTTTNRKGSSNRKRQKPSSSKVK